MHGVLPGDSEIANKSTDQAADQMVSEDWFSAICRSLLPKDAGFALHIATGFQERTCYRYAAGDRAVSGDFIRALLRSEQGKTWLAAIMDGSDAQWWHEHQQLIADRERLGAIKQILAGWNSGSTQGS